MVAGTNVLGSQLALLTSSSGHRPRAVVARARALARAPLLVPHRRDGPVPRSRRSRPGIGGAWLLLVVSTESVAVLGALLAPSVGATEACCLSRSWRTLSGDALRRGDRPDLLPLDVLPALRRAGDPSVLDQHGRARDHGARRLEPRAGGGLLAGAGAARAVPHGHDVAFWGFATWWIPLLLAIGVWRHGVKRVPIRYDPQYWSLVFPLGMYSVSTFGSSWRWMSACRRRSPRRRSGSRSLRGSSRRSAWHRR